MTREDIEETVAPSGQRSRRARAAGSMPLELTEHIGYVGVQFISADCNQRTDKYGGGFLTGKTHFIMMPSGSAKQVGHDFPMSIRFSSKECIKNRYTISDMQTKSPINSPPSADMINVSFGAQLAARK